MITIGRERIRNELPQISYFSLRMRKIKLNCATVHAICLCKLFLVNLGDQHANRSVSIITEETAHIDVLLFFFSWLLFYKNENDASKT